ncbi:MAG TPA: nitrite reductase large subunit NirB [Rhodopila sp.]|nr:nitrite reductase large subunit NirB [Rhodopila sp.]HVY17651.1 nitrite reductase large subunit NirB [Rhodopila sp.]
MIAPKRSRLVLVGNGMAGVRAVEEILARAPQTFQITVFGAEPHGNYNRIMLSPVLAGEKTFEAITTHPRSWYEENEIELIAGEPVVTIDRAAKTVTGALGTTRPYDVLILATGSNPIIIPVPGHRLPGVIGFRDIADVGTMLAVAKTHRKAIVIGGGLLGLEAANGLLRNGMDVTVLHLMPTLMERQLDPVSAGLLKAELEGRGMRILTEANTAAIHGADRVGAVELKDGTRLDADLVVMSAGIRPNIALAKDAGLACNRGIQVDDGMRTSDPAVFAVGECIEHRGAVFGLVAPLWDMAKVLADRITGTAETDYVPAITGTRLKVTGVDMFSAGDFMGDDTTEDIVFRDARRGVHKKLVVRDDKLVGCVLYGAAADGSWYFDMIRNGTDVGAIRDTMVFGPSIAPGAPAGVETLPDTAEICGCNGVSKGTILAAIDKHKLTTLDQVRGRTKASSSCGSCTCQVEALLGLALGGDYKAAPKVKPVCKCTGVGHGELRKAIVARQLKTIPAVMQAMGWTTPDGCASCRPALNYYLLCAWPGEYVDASASRFVNERMHANIQKDGTYSVVPRMWGGTTTAAELRAIADVVDKFQIPSVKVTGGQRIDLLGVKKDDLPAVWKDLNAAGMVSGHAYGKALRTVKTCVGSEWCRFGTQDSTGMGVALEKMTWGSWTPHKTKMAVSGCPRNCAEATIKDFGVVATEAGWDLHVGGNGGIKVRVTDLLAKVTTGEEVLEYAGAFMQFYREDAWYLERTAPWIERVGIETVRETLADPATRKALHERFLYSQRFSQDDPWTDRAQGAEAHEFKPLAEVS